jgi:predicted transcriptional regulator
MDLATPHRAVVPSLDGDVLLVLSRAETPLTGRQVARLVEHASPAGVKKVLDRLAGQGLVLRESAGRAHLYRLNRDHLAAPIAMALADLRAQLLDRLRGEVASWDLAPVHASLFGSAARQVGDATSDLDLFLVRPSEVSADDPRWESQVDALREAGYRWTGNHVQVVELDESECKRLVSTGAELTRSAREDAVDLYGTPARRLLRDAR